MKARRLLRSEASDGPRAKVVLARHETRCHCPKLGYTSRKLAATAAADARAETGEDIRHYRCGHGHVWHIGHPIGSRPTVRPDLIDPTEETR